MVVISNKDSVQYCKTSKTNGVSSANLAHPREVGAHHYYPLGEGLDRRSLLTESRKQNTVGVFKNVLSTLGNSMYYNNYIESPRVETALQWAVFCSRSPSD